MNVIAKVKCRCGTRIRIRTHEVPSNDHMCWKCGAAVSLIFVRRDGGTGLIVWQGKETRTQDVEIEVVELP